MKCETFWKWSLGLALVVLALPGGSSQESTNSAPVITSTTNTTAGTTLAAITNAPSPEAAAKALEQAAGEVVSRPSAPPQGANMSGPAADVAKLAEAGLEESVMLSYVTNSTHTFNLSSDAIIYLNDIGVPGTVVTAMIQHDQSIKDSAASSGTLFLQSNQSSPTPTPQPSYSAPSAVAETTEPEAAPPAVAEGGSPPAQVNGAYTYFYDSLSPYGNWINVTGYGWCWQPTVVVGNPMWRPYADGGHWVYTDTGWYWASDYSWGWAPFHYGRWFHHNYWGWCWAPDTVWGPAWVSWRYGDGYCGWAPLPPYACFTPGIGFTYFGSHVGFSFGFGLSAGFFTFVDYGHFTDRHWHHHRMHGHDADHCFEHSRVSNRIYEHRGTVHNEGIPVSKVAAATRMQVPRLHVREAGDPARVRLGQPGQDRQTLAVYRPNLPRPSRATPFVGQGIKPNPELRLGARPAIGQTPGIANRSGSRQPLSAVNVQSRRQTPLPGFQNRPLPDSASRPLPGFQNKPLPDSASRPLPGFKNEPFPGSRNQPAQPAARGLQPATPAQNHSVVIIRDQAHPTIRAESPPAVQTQPRPQYQRAAPQVAPKYSQQDQRTFTQPPAPVRSPPPAQSRGWAPAAQPREHQGGIAPVQRSAPPAQSQPAQVAPQAQPRQAPASHSSTPSSSQGSSRGNSPRSNR